ncbi:DUF6973 domain-containing protein [Muriicola marianensis]|uniref:DUF6973 domain-containing protein n=1 Tax=Muriicola marianensis TaxID=1324801 RepID=A0ABQ1QZ03_9FLAO|nr:hypothetical protein [Muriicola marianensis]GGD49019.1 hypothetical protein GCM10011361_14710 [Muriicola marianensis]
MNEIWAVIRRARPRQLFRLVWLCLTHIRLVWPTYRATKKTISIADEHFAHEHRRNTPANAFRHALWNWMIAKECTLVVKEEEKVLRWTELITDMHERILPGNTLTNAMDLHNNAVGRTLFRNEERKNNDRSVSLFLEMTENSLLVSSLQEIQQTPETRLVHLINTVS